MSMFNRSFTWGLIPRLFRGAFGMRDPPVSDSDGFIWFFGWGDVGDGTRRHHGPWNVSCDHFHVATSNSPNSIYFVRLVTFPRLVVRERTGRHWWVKNGSILSPE